MARGQSLGDVPGDAQALGRGARRRLARRASIAAVVAAALQSAAERAAAHERVHKTLPEALGVRGEPQELQDPRMPVGGARRAVFKSNQNKTRQIKTKQNQ